MDALPRMHSANFDELNNRSFIEKLRDWTCILIACIIMARPSEVCEYCPVVESLEGKKRLDEHVFGVLDVELFFFNTVL